MKPILTVILTLLFNDIRQVAFAVRNDHEVYSISSNAQKQRDHSSKACLEKNEYDSIKFIHHQLDDDANGDIDISETDEFLRDELKYKNGNERRKGFHRYDKHISLSELWQAWKSSEVHNWTTEDTISWLILSVELPQYAKAFEEQNVNGTTLPDLAANDGQLISNKLGVKDSIHRRKIVLKAMDAVLFGPAKADRNLIKDGILVLLLLVAIGGIWFAYVQHKYSQIHLRKMMSDMEALQTAEDSLVGMQQELEKARQEQENAAFENKKLEKRLKRENSKDFTEILSEEECYYQVDILEHQVETLQNELERTGRMLKLKQWIPPPSLQLWLQLTYGLELENYNAKKCAAEHQLLLAKEGCDKLRKKKTQMFGSFRIAHGGSMDDIDQKIMEAKTALSEVTKNLKERLERWQQIEGLCGFPIVQNPGMAYLKSLLYGSLNGKLKLLHQAETKFLKNDSSDALLEDNLSPSAGSLARNATFPKSLMAASPKHVSPSNSQPDIQSTLPKKNVAVVEPIVETYDSSSDTASNIVPAVNSQDIVDKATFTVGSPTESVNSDEFNPIISAAPPLINRVTNRAPNSRQSSSDSFNPPCSSHENSVSPPRNGTSKKNTFSSLFLGKSRSNGNLEDCSTDSSSLNEEVKKKKRRSMLHIRKSKQKSY